MKQLLAAAIAAYLLKYPKLKSEAVSQEACNQFIGDQLANVLQYFKAHPGRSVFFSTSDMQVFYDLPSATNHASSTAIENKTVLQIDRADVEALLGAKPGEAESKAADLNNDYSKLSVEDLVKLCIERGIQPNEGEQKSILIKLLLESTGNPGTLEPLAEKPDYNALTVAKLKEECEKRSIATDAFKKKDEYVAALVADDEAKTKAE